MLPITNNSSYRIRVSYNENQTIIDSHQAGMLKDDTSYIQYGNIRIEFLSNYSDKILATDSIELAKKYQLAPPTISAITVTDTELRYKVRFMRAHLGPPPVTDPIPVDRTQSISIPPDSPPKRASSPKPISSSHSTQRPKNVIDQTLDLLKKSDGYRNKKNYEQALNCINKAFELHNAWLSKTDYNMLYSKILILFALERYDEALECINLYESSDCEYIYVQYELTPNQDQNVETLKKAILARKYKKQSEVEEKYYTPYYDMKQAASQDEKRREDINQGNKYFAAGDWQNALSYFNRALNYFPLNTDICNVKLWPSFVHDILTEGADILIKKAQIYQKLGRSREAKECFQECESCLQRHEVYLRRDEGVVRDHYGNIDDPYVGNKMTNCAEIFLQLGLKDRAKNYLQQCDFLFNQEQETEDDGNRDKYFKRGKCYLILNEYKKTLTNFQTAFKLYMNKYANTIKLLSENYPFDNDSDEIILQKRHGKIIASYIDSENHRCSKDLTQFRFANLLSFPNEDWEAIYPDSIEEHDIELINLIIPACYPILSEIKDFICQTESLGGFKPSFVSPTQESTTKKPIPVEIKNVTPEPHTSAPVVSKIESESQSGGIFLGVNMQNHKASLKKTTPIDSSKKADPSLTKGGFLKKPALRKTPARQLDEPVVENSELASTLTKRKERMTTQVNTPKESVPSSSNIEVKSSGRDSYPTNVDENGRKQKRNELLTEKLSIFIAYRSKLLLKQSKSQNGQNEKEIEHLDQLISRLKKQQLSASSESKQSISISTYEVVKVPGDGHCLYSAVGLYVGKDQNQLREQVAKELESKLPTYESFMELKSHQTPQQYIKSVRQGLEWAGDVEITALMHILQRPIIVVHPGEDPQKRLQNPTEVEKQYSAKGLPILVNYNGINHYDALILVVQDNSPAHSLPYHAQSGGSRTVKENSEPVSKFKEVKQKALNQVNTEKKSIPNHSSPSIAHNAQAFFSSGTTPQKPATSFVKKAQLPSKSEDDSVSNTGTSPAEFFRNRLKPIPEIEKKDNPKRSETKDSPPLGFSSIGITNPPNLKPSEAKNSFFNKPVKEAKVPIQIGIEKGLPKQNPNINSSTTKRVSDIKEGNPAPGVENRPVSSPESHQPSSTPAGLYNNIFSELLNRGAASLGKNKKPDVHSHTGTSFRPAKSEQRH